MEADLWINFTNNPTMSDQDVKDYVADLNDKFFEGTEAVLMGPRLVGRRTVKYLESNSVTDDFNWEDLFAKKPPLPTDHF